MGSESCSEFWSCKCVPLEILWVSSSPSSSPPRMLSSTLISRLERQQNCSGTHCCSPSFYLQRLAPLPVCLPAFATNSLMERDRLSERLDPGIPGTALFSLLFYYLPWQLFLDVCICVRLCAIVCVNTTHTYVLCVFLCQSHVLKELCMILYVKGEGGWSTL